ncbi:hypothetical protein Cob_v008024 [Colletotrichum orbiculare MAFF 240422]|uniref:PLD phosphodiesterase domain-containing protein n=1 Tax=Colletotrichum orbiculare (strain 104-T / ATCC 96160 / CBS 514.97 / LARS 414 / MAFF 240422) TaxID=1213857 RepID=A0A484FM35_COLOR|nr:hypothetical protein Cob_v008024 [Colletotrichum orbiculare MAFF 240422]
MSENNSRAVSPPSNVDDDPDLALAIALSLQSGSAIAANFSDDSSSARAEPSLPPPKVGAGRAFGTLTLDREQMEKERLARALKRSSEQAGLEDAVEKPKLSRLEAPNTWDPSLGKLDCSEKSDHPNDPCLPFPNGIFKRTWALGHLRTGDDIKIEEVLQKDRLQLAVLSSFQWDEEWLLSKIDCSRTKTILVAYAADDAQKAIMQSNVPVEQILKFEGYLRVVIPSGNLVPYDWGENGVLENMVFLIDLPRLNDTQGIAPPVETPFGTELRYFLRALGLDEKLVKSLDNYDFSETSRYGFVHTISGSHTGDSRWRYCGLANTVRCLGLATDHNVDVDYLASSLGSLNHGYLKHIYDACRGNSGLGNRDVKKLQSTDKRTGKAGGPVAGTGVNATVELQRHFRIYFPTEKTVSKSRGGRSAAGTICVQEKWWKSSTFPRELLRDCESAREGLLLHSKAIFVRGNSRGGGGSGAWAYVGSANLSESAWGRLVKDRQLGTTKLNCRNWECGVLVAVNTATDGAGPRTRWGAGRGAQSQGQSLMRMASQSEGIAAVQQHDESALLKRVFATTMPIPMKVPTGCYASDESAASRPWFFMKSG